MKIGIYGGTFNPVHFGHLRSAEEIYHKFKLKEVIFVLSANPPHKNVNELIDPMHRMKMLTLAITGNDHFSVSDIEMVREGKSYTIDTLREFKTKFPEAELFFIMGLDAFLEIKSWHHYKELFSVSNFIVTIRSKGQVVSPSKIIPHEIRQEFKWHQKQKEYEHKSGNRVILSSISNFDISSRQIRELVARGESIRYLLPRRVMEYILEHNFYRK